MFVEDWLDRLSSAETAERAFAIASQALEGLGLDRVIYVMADGVAQSAEVHSAMPSWWDEQYQAEHLAEHDPLVTRGCDGFQPLATGQAYLERYDYLDADERTYIHKAADAGFVAGCALPLGLRGAGLVGGFNIGTAQPRRELESIMAEHGDAIRIGLLYTHAAIERARVRGPRLSQREQQCLQLLARGRQTKQIAAELGIGCSTVELHLRGARRKLVAVTREQAVARAAYLGLITA